VRRPENPKDLHPPDWYAEIRAAGGAEILRRLYAVAERSGPNPKHLARPTESANDCTCAQLHICACVKRRSALAARCAWRIARQSPAWLARNCPFLSRTRSRAIFSRVASSRYAQEYFNPAREVVGCAFSVRAFPFRLATGVALSTGDSNVIEQKSRVTQALQPFVD
jgi:hypothetical protein